MKAFLTDYENYCALCGSPSSEFHHLLMGSSRRKIADSDKIFLCLCRKCHEEIHHNSTANRLSKIVGQLAFEFNTVADKEKILDARQQFRERYGKSYL